MRILFVTPHYAPDVNAPAIRARSLVEHWISRGHEAVVLTGIPTRAPEEESGPYDRGFLHREVGERLEVLRTWFVPHTGIGVMNRAFSYASFGLSAHLLGLPRVGKVDCVVGSSPHIFSALTGYTVARVQGVPFVLEVRDLWSQAIRSLGGMVRHAASALIQEVEDHLYRHADRIVVVTEGARNHLVRTGIPAEKIAVVPHGVDLSLYPEAPRIFPRTASDPGDPSFTVGYLGNHGQAQSLQVVLEAARALREVKEFRFVFAGSGPMKETLRDEARRLALNNVTFLPPVSHEKAPQLWRSLDVCLVPLANLPALQYAVPSKLFEAMVSETPIVCAASPEANQMVTEVGAGIAVEPESPAEMVRALRHIRANPEDASEMGRRGREFVVRTRSAQVIGERFLDVLRAI